MKPYVKPAMLECRCHPGTGLWCREDGCVFIPDSRARKAHWTYGFKTNRTGYMGVGFRGKRYYVHRLIAESFLDNLLNLPEIDHKDRNPQNNKSSNLRFADRKTQNDNKQCVEDSLAKYGVRNCEDRNAYYRARIAKDHDFVERQYACQRAYRAKQKALGKRRRKCPDGKHCWLTDAEYDALFGNNSQQMQLF